MTASFSTWVMIAALACLMATPQAAVKQKGRYPPAPITPPMPPPALPVTLPIFTTFNLPATACSSIITDPDITGAQFRYLVSNDTAITWDQNFPTAIIVPGNVNTEIYTFRCTNLPGKRALRGAQPVSTVTIHSSCYLPVGVTQAQAQVASSTLVQALTTTYLHGPLASKFNISLAQVTTHPAFSLIFCTGTPAQVLCQGGTNVSISWWNTQPWLPKGK